MGVNNQSFIELNGRERAQAILDQGTFCELLGPFDGIESPHLPKQNIVPQSDDGVIIAGGLIAGEPAVVISIEGRFQGGGIGEVSGAKIAGALELALNNLKKGVPVRPVFLFDTGGVRLQEANYGLLSISEISSAVVALREHTPVVGVISGNVGCFGGMSITASLFSYLIMTKEARFGLNGPEVIEQEAGVEEFDARDRSLIWKMIGGIQRYETGFADALAQDDVTAIQRAVQETFQKKGKVTSKTEQVDFYRHLLSKVDPSEKLAPDQFQELYKATKNEPIPSTVSYSLNEVPGNMPNSRGRVWINALINDEEADFEIPSVLYKDALLGREKVRYISVVPNPYNRFLRARKGEVGLDEGWAIAKHVREVIKEDRNQSPRPIIAIVDVPSQAYGYHEELLGIHYACGAAADAYAAARLAGHPVITLIVGKAISGAFLAHGYQSNRIVALKDEGVNVHAMSKQSAARITKRSIKELEEASKKVPSMAYDIESFASLGALYELVSGIQAEQPTERDVQTIQDILTGAVEDVRREGVYDLSTRLYSEQARKEGRKASLVVRGELEKQWNI
ncbi:biotin-independent malonate decarboxylase subunit beta [Priestia megaterium]|jgi:malonate decarboxylase beta subunit|uniref:biotin-independent malonate decarboxylase subunit beta n=1 Tax=Priestia megaterium TaxID=1404 RepID=UPI0022801091|nr:biotin-independent malonate decarboxylase subunit beta [Priestia megaterium]MCY9017764.1 biotin-independent malonate decarboxylase subunit beta [Priestia megaterium]MCY9023910.1 biotin-independent malonate decarboxylase subunit beta [Priestia megaterium]